ncbi:la-related protein 6B [Tripterygium wilfordii]|uniref:La-related protein 6B n=1 Tax=Tripterygium wilfordii TaxID=458696 RepID=A0A7J7CHQ2_TRIWF|nr:la-related protein 6B-like isoform X2 [Tripterygium wilfordii]KAF5733564.1 la-related protein 6B [Tripterygium wilfordii]
MAQEDDLDSDKSQSQATSSSTEPSLSRNLSLSKLNAQAPAFVPTRNPTSRSDPPPHQQQQRLVIPPPPMVHVYPPAAAASPTHPPPPPPFHVPVHSPVRVPTHVVPIQNHHSQHHSNQRNHQRHQNHYHPHSQHHQYVPVHYHGQDQYHDSGVGEQEVEASTKKGHQTTQAQGEQNHGDPPSKNGVSEEAAQKILNQVEYYFSDLNLATTDHLMRCISKDPEGYVPISVVASFKKIKTLLISNSQLATVLRTSPKLVVSEDGKKVRRQHLLTDMEGLQSRIVVAENLPEDHCHQNLMKFFSSVGSVKTIRTCQPQASSGGTSSASRSAKADGMHCSNKLHAFVEYESVEFAEKAVTELNDEGNWRSGLRVCLMLKRTAKSAQARGKKANDGEGHYEEEDTSMSDLRPNDKQAGDSSQQFDVHSHDHTGEGHINDKDGLSKKGRNRGQGKDRGRTQHQQNNRGHHMGTPLSNNMVFNEQQIPAKQPPGPRMPDGTRGFAMGRGKPVAVNME